MEGKLVLPGICAPTSKATQMLNMPEVADGEPYALRAMLANDGDQLNQYLIDFSIGDRFEIKDHSGYAWMFEQCLGERSHGNGVALEFRPRASFDFCDSADEFTWSLDDVELEPSASCPTVGRVLNGDFEGTGGWTSDRSPDFTIGEGLGSCGSRGGRLSTTKACESPMFHGEVSIPSSSIPNAAVRFSAIGTPGTRLVSTLGTWNEGGSVDVHVMDGAAHEYLICVPEWAKGVATKIMFRLEGGGACADAAVRDVLVDDFSIVSAPTACPAITNIIDGGFELGHGWNFIQSYGTQDSIGIEESASEARSGTHSLRIRVESVCDYKDAGASVTVPEPTAGAGPAVTFYYRFQKSASANTIFTISTFAVGATPAVLPESASYTKFVYCLDPSRKNHHSEFHVVGGVNGGGNCSLWVPPETLHVDDISVGTDPSCPVE